VLASTTSTRVPAKAAPTAVIDVVVIKAGPRLTPSKHHKNRLIRPNNTALDSAFERALTRVS
jgi:hypothetical protein